jgi:GDP-mannose 6-dehydrogenase
MRIAIFGLGYVGTVTAAGLASQGHEVWGVDVDQVKVDLIRSGKSPVVEPGIDDLIATAVGRGDLNATTDPVVALERADVSLLCVGTPSMPQGGTDLTYLQRALDDIREALAVVTPPASGFHAVVVRSTVPPAPVMILSRQRLPVRRRRTGAWVPQCALSSSVRAQGLPTSSIRPSSFLAPPISASPNW